MSVLDLVQQHLGQGELQQLSQQIGADPAQTQTAVEAALPMLLGSMAQTARQPGGAGDIAGAMQEHAGLLGGLGNLGNLGNLGGGLGGILASAVGGGLLGKVLGGNESAVEGGVQQASGLDSNQTKKLLMLLAPIVLAMLARRRQQAAQSQAAQTSPTAGAGAMLDSDGDGIPDALEREAQQAREQTERRSPHIGGIIGKILDAAQRPARG